MADQTLDLRGIIAPVTLLKISQTFSQMQPEQTLEIWCGDPETRCDLFKILPPSSYEVLLAEASDKETEYRFTMKKKRTL